MYDNNMHLTYKSLLRNGMLDLNRQKNMQMLENLIGIVNSSSRERLARVVLKTHLLSILCERLLECIIKASFDNTTLNL